MEKFIGIKKKEENERDYLKAKMENKKKIPLLLFKVKIIQSLLIEWKINQLFYR